MIEYILVGAAVFTSACTLVFRMSSNVSDILVKCVLVIFADLNTFMPLMYSRTIEIILEVRSRLIVQNYHALGQRQFPVDKKGSNQDQAAHDQCFDDRGQRMGQYKFKIA